MRMKKAIWKNSHSCFYYQVPTAVTVQSVVFRVDNASTVQQIPKLLSNMVPPSSGLK